MRKSTCVFFMSVFSLFADAQPLLVQNQQNGAEAVSFILANPRSVPVTAWAIRLTVTFSDGYQTTLTDLVDDYQTPPLPAAGTRSETIPLPTRDAATVTSAAVAVDATIYDDNVAAGNRAKIADMVRVRKLDVRQLQHTLERLTAARAQGPSQLVAVLESQKDLPSNDSRVKAHQHDYDAIVGALKNVKSQDQMQQAVDGLIAVLRGRLAKAQRAAEVQP